MNLRPRRVLVALTVATAASVLSMPAASAASVVLAQPPANTAARAADTGWLRLAHLSPDTEDVDVYLSAAAGSAKPIVLRSVGYGDVSTYLSVAKGRYSAMMRRAGSAATSPTVVSMSVDVSASRAYTVAVVGVRSALAGRVLLDDLTPPPSGQSRIRLVQGSTRAPSVQVQAIGGPVLAQSARFASATGYANVPAGRWSLRITPTSGSAKPLTTTLDAPAGRVSTVFVLDGAGTDTLKVNARVDSEGAAAMPLGGVNTGYGPASRTQQRPGLPVRPFQALLMVVAALAAVRVVSRLGARTAVRS